jgi:Cytochrome c oxidase subunit III
MKPSIITSRGPQSWPFYHLEFFLLNCNWCSLLHFFVAVKICLNSHSFTSNYIASWWRDVIREGTFTDIIRLKFKKVYDWYVIIIVSEVFFLLHFFGLFSFQFAPTHA